MKIIDLQVIPFWVPRTPFYNGEFGAETKVVQTVTKIITDEGAEDYYFGGYGHGDHDGLPAEQREQREQREQLEGRIKSLVVGHDPYDREEFWHWMWVANIPENLLSVVDCTLWDLQARAMGLPVHKLLGGCRDKVKAYASTFPNIGDPETYAQHALECKLQCHASGRQRSASRAAS